MQKNRILLPAVLVLLCLPLLRAQDAAKDAPGKPAAEPAPKAEVPLKVQVTLSEFDGNQKISSLPYTIHTLGTDLRNRRRDELRFGVRIPVAASGGGFTYQDVGTNIDCQAITRDDGQYALDITIERSSVMSASNGKEADWKSEESSSGMQPLLRHFRDEFVVVMHDGQATEGVSAVDPATGRVLKVDVTLYVAK
jgi:hypothetical protein